MVVQVKADPRKKFHIDSGLAEILFLWSNCPIEKVPEPKRVPKTTWGVEPTAYGPYIQGRCASCGDVFRAMGPTAHKSQKFGHCGVQEPIPADIAAAYERLLKEAERMKKATPAPAKSEESATLRMFEISDRIYDGNAEYVGSNPMIEEN
jgi:hypothetical protein